MEVNNQILKTLIKSIYERSVSAFVTGTFGIGKSYSVRESAEEIARINKKKFVDWNKTSSEEKKELLNSKIIEKCFIFVDIRASQLDISDTRGLPSFNEDVVEWKPNMVFKVLSHPRASGILFLDELNLASPMVMASLYQIILDRSIGELSFPSAVVPVAAGNTSADRANVFDLPAPLANRFVHFNLRIPTQEEWIDWGLKHDIDSRIIAFIQWKGSKLFTWNQKETDKAVATPRSWVMASTLIKEVYNEDELYLLVSSAVGEGNCAEFIAFNKLSNQIDIQDILKHPKKIKEITRLDLKYNLISLLTEHYRKNKDKKHLLQLAELSLPEYIEAEFGVLLLRMLRAVKEDTFTDDLKNTPIGIKIATHYGKYLS